MRKKAKWFYRLIVLTIATSAYSICQSPLQYSARAARILEPHTDVVASVILPKDSTIIVTQGFDGLIRGIRISSNSILYEIPIGLSSVLVGMAYNQVYDAIAFSDGANVTYFRVPDGKTMREFSARDQVSALDWSPDGKLLAVGTVAGSVQISDIVLGKQLQSQSYYSPITTTTFSSDGKFVAIALENGEVKLCDSRSLKADKVLSNEKTPIAALRFVNNDQSLACAGINGSIVLVDVASLSRTFLAEGYVWGNKSLATTPDKQGLFWVGQDGVIRYQQLNTMDSYEIKPAGGRISSMDVHQSGKRFVVGNTLNRVQIFELEGFESLTIPEPITTRDMEHNVHRPPSIILTQPQIKPGSRLLTRSPLVNIEGFTYDEDGIVAVDVNFRFASLRSASPEEIQENKLNKKYMNFSTSLSLASGRNDITVSVTDSSGLKAVYPFSILLDTVKPTIILKSPVVTRGMKISTQSDTLQLQGTVFDESGVDMVVVNGREASLSIGKDGTEFAGEALLVLGTNEVEIKAVDKLGNEGTLKFAVLHEPQVIEPALSIGNYYGLRDK